ncbi:OPT/YSL family transporter [Vitiosangium sp. GDMCC 1.1324]|uniref:OPT/YSL family transporter n=1 Tax=Vitiosangium sp. (strain GDMCC 1.1324) TaxID=2138576 RepID=UPI000D3C2D03|nr:OPT/YSL family transporter [Vitiosangium sp. GDMCC 1.1324]PTL83929.1 peptide transporter [Vitiosangium sp. GDMCC 1.1324]
MPSAERAPIGRSDAPFELTFRALAAGGLIGAGLALCNVYMGLKLGLWESGGVLASLLAFSGMKALSTKGGPVPSALETNLAQTAAAAAGAMPAAAGLMGAIPALSLLGRPVPGWAVGLWGVGLGALGVLVAFALRRRLLEEEALPFPSGAVTAELVSTLHAGGGAPAMRAGWLWGASLGGMGLTWLREVGKVFPAVSFFPGALGGVPLARLQLGVGWSPMLLGLGVLVGPQVGLSLLLGALVAWGVLAPWLVREGRVASDSYELLVAWLTWPGVGLMVGASVVTLVSLGRSLPKVAADLLRLGHQHVARGGAAREGWVLALPLAVLLVLGVGYTAFELHPLELLLVLLLLLPLCTVGARAAGLMDMSPVATMGDLQQVVFGAVSPGQPVLGVAAGSVAAGAMAQTGVALWSFQAGRLLRASPSRQLGAQLAGVLLGGAVSVPTYFLLVGAHGAGSPELPVPFALQFRVVAEVSARGLAGLPPSTVLAAGLGVAGGLTLSWLSQGRLARFVPSATALGLGFLVPAHYAVTLCLGALLAEGIRRARPGASSVLQVLGAGAIVGESLLGLLLLVLGLFGLMG